MDIITRNMIFMDHLDLIQRTLNRNRPLLYALHLEQDDVYQELAMAALQAIESFDASRSASISTHIWMQLQYAILDLKRRRKSHGLTGASDFAPTVWSLELSEEYGHPIAVDPYEEEPLCENRLRQALSKLAPSERQAVLLYLEGTKPRRRAEREMLNIAMEKLREFYLALQDATEAMALLHTHQVFGGMISEP